MTEPKKRPSIEVDSLRLGVAAFVSALVFCVGLAWTARGVVADISANQMAAEARLLKVLEDRYGALADRVTVVETRLGIRGAAEAAHVETMPTSNGD